MFANNIYCDKCRRCIGFMLDIPPMPKLYCLQCEEAVRADYEGRRAMNEAYRTAVNATP